MEIGSKLKAARANAKLTQENAAEALGISRQTLSNWENEKTYPDIVSVVKMSELYSVSLDHLLKEEKTMSTNYLDYLEESTNTVKSKKKQSVIILLAVYLFIWAGSLFCFWCTTFHDDAAIFALTFLYLVIPVTTIIISFIIGKNNYMGGYKWYITVFFGIMYMLLEYCTFSMANMVSFNKLNAPAFELIAFGMVLSAVAMAIGAIANRRKKNKQSKITERTDSPS